MIELEADAPSAASCPLATSPSSLRTFTLAFAVCLFNVAGNLSLAWSMKHFRGSLAWSPIDYLHAMFSPYAAAGIVLLILWLLTRMALLSWADLSFVLPITGVGYVLAAVCGQVFLHETVEPSHWLGTLLIFIGTLLVGMTDQRTGPVRSGRE